MKHVDVTLVSSKIKVSSKIGERLLKMDSCESVALKMSIKEVQ